MSTILLDSSDDESIFCNSINHHDPKDKIVIGFSTRSNDVDAANCSFSSEGTDKENIVSPCHKTAKAKTSSARSNDMASDSSSDSDLSTTPKKQPRKAKSVRRGCRNLPVTAIQTSSIYSKQVENCFLNIARQKSIPLPHNIKGHAQDDACQKQGSEDAEDVIELADTSNSECAQNTLDLLESLACESPSIESVQSPSPPPPPPIDPNKLPKRKTRMNPKLRKAIQSLECTQSALLVNDRLQISDGDISFEGEERAEDKTVLVKVRSLSGAIQRFSMTPSMPFSEVISEMTRRTTLTVERCIMLVLQDYTIKPEDTAHSLDINVADIIDCHVVNRTEDVQEKITLYVQAKSSRSKVAISIGTKETMHKVISLYAKQVNKQISRLSLSFDGELITGTETPESLDMSEGDCIDVIEA